MSDLRLWWLDRLTWVYWHLGAYLRARGVLPRPYTYGTIHPVVAAPMPTPDREPETIEASDVGEMPASVVASLTAQAPVIPAAPKAPRGMEYVVQRSTSSGEPEGYTGYDSGKALAKWVEFETDRRRGNVHAISWTENGYVRVSLPEVVSEAPAAESPATPNVAAIGIPSGVPAAAARMDEIRQILSGVAP